MAKKGSDMLIKIGDGDDTSETFTTIAGMRSTDITHNNESVDVTTKDSNHWRELLAGGGTRSMTISGSGVFEDSESEATLRAKAAEDAIPNFELIIPDFGTYKGAFMISNVSYAGEHNGEITYSISLESSGEVAFTPAS